MPRHYNNRNKIGPRSHPWMAWGIADKPKNNSNCRPKGLRGRDIGLFYRDRQQNKRKEEEKRENVVNLRIPPSVIRKLNTNLGTIGKIAKSKNVNIEAIKAKNGFLTSIEAMEKEMKQKMKSDFSRTKNDFDKDKAQEGENENNCIKNKTQLELDSDDDATREKEKLKMELDASNLLEKELSSKIKTHTNHECKNKISNTTITDKEIKTDADNQPNTSSAPDFIMVPPSDNDSIQKSRYKSYKYSYEDIVTDTFQEKLQKCLNEGISNHLANADNISTVILEEYNQMITTTEYKKMLDFRKQLPTYKKSKEIVEILSKNQVIVISGETGCGKSTQVPQIILDDAILSNRGANVKIIVTQPRRIAASSLAIRVAKERAEELGNSVGYAIRLEKVDARDRGSIMFCTTGVLLTELEVNQGLTNYSHIILDEVHERDCQVDIAMCMLKQILRKRKDLKLILMSATIDAEKLMEYFDNCPMLHIEGLAYPVKDIYMEDILKLTRYRMMPEEKPRKSAPKWQRHGRNANVKTSEDFQNRYIEEAGGWLRSICKKVDRDIFQMLSDHRIEILDLDLIVELLVYICKQGPGAILVFLPGIADISKLINVMTHRGAFPKSHYEIYPLHSKLSTVHQHKIFERPPSHVRKIIIATNIAETSITIDDVVYVVDSGKIKLTGINVEQNLLTLQTEWVSQANLRQRRGRAGRCQPGICYHLLSKFRAQNIPERLLPELQRSDLIEPILLLKKLRLGMAMDAMKMVISPPAVTTVYQAVRHLQQIGALDSLETLTPLGWHLARLPVPPAAGKLLLLGALFGCLDRAASIAAVWGFKDPFLIVIGKEKEVDEAKRSFTIGEPSDHVAISEAIMEWEKCSNQDKHKFAYQYFLSSNTLQMLSEMKKQFGSNLKQMGFLTTSDVKAKFVNRNSYNLSLFKSVVAAALYPNIAYVRWIGIHSRNRHKAIRIKVYTPEDGLLALHPSSVMAPQKPGGLHCETPGATWLVYSLKQRSTSVYLFDVTLFSTLPLLFFGEFQVERDTDRDNCILTICSSTKVRCKIETAKLVYELRGLLDKILADRIMTSVTHTMAQNDFEENVLNAVIELITAEDECAEELEDDYSTSEYSD